MRNLLCLMIALYQNYVSALVGARCRFAPTCSQYCKEALVEHGVARGLLLGFWRLLRCNPFSDGGYDPVKSNFCKDKNNKKRIFND
jgi:putative membrane protein insertion efficiency factor